MSTTSYAGFVAVLVGLALPWGVSSAEAAERTDPSHASKGQASQDQVVKDRAKKDQGKQKKASRSDGLEPGELRRAAVVKHGWWWTANQPPPETGVLAAPQPPNPAPQGTLAVSAMGGDPERLAALEVRLAAKPGSSVRSFDMVLRESDEPGANVNAEAATILACPVTELFWADGTAAAWQDRPTYDCETGVEGKRTDAGLWRFDLTDLASAWLAEDSTDSPSVVLVEGVEEPESFQVALEGQKLDGIGLALKATPPVAVDLDTSGEDNSAGGDAGVGSTSSGGGSSSTSGGGSSSGGSLGGGSLGGGDVEVLGAPEPVMAGGDGQPATDGEQQQAVGLVPMAGAPAWYSGLPRAGLLLIPFALGLAYLVMLSLGPDGRPVPAVGRHGVSRALDRLRQVGRTTGAGR